VSLEVGGASSGFPRFFRKRRSLLPIGIPCGRSPLPQQATPVAAATALLTLVPVRSSYGVTFE
jgi:hypothetical protein